MAFLFFTCILVECPWEKNNLNISSMVFSIRHNPLHLYAQSKTKREKGSFLVQSWLTKIPEIPMTENTQGPLSSHYIKSKGHIPLRLNFFFKFTFLPQEPLHLRNRELLVLKAQLQRRVEELQRDADAKSTRSNVHTPPRLSSPVSS